MKIDFDEINNILSTFIDADTPFITLRELGFFTKEGTELNSLIFHLNLLVETGLISNRKLETGSMECIGVVFHSTNIGGRAIPIRLTMAGHDFAKSLNQIPILERIKKELSDAPFELIKQAAGQWAEKLLKDKLGLK
ncbi:DUF2513 domain-containing protein [Salmonella enterica subsp. enterica serovar Poona]|nr:DUF2513 domain-containing protein [Salmonella enterica subsp. enterica serovar Poona]ELM0493097.1 DUF2513 domain-containing protein [Salmonella enterica]ELS4260412.1 DUF2513 domain-containing protein [Salmonella enterica]